MRRQEEADREHEDPELNEERDDKDDDLDDLDDDLEMDEPGGEEPIPVQRGEIEHAEKGRSGDVGETDDRVAWTEDDGGTEPEDQRK